MARLAELKLRFRLRMAIPILEAPWRKKLHSSLPVPQHLGGLWCFFVGVVKRWWTLVGWWVGGFSLVTLVGWLVSWLVGGWLMVGWSGVWFLKMPGAEVAGWQWRGKMMRTGFCFIGSWIFVTETVREVWWWEKRALYYICSLPLSWSQLWKTFGWVREPHPWLNVQKIQVYHGLINYPGKNLGKKHHLCIYSFACGKRNLRGSKIHHVSSHISLLRRFQEKHNS